MSDKASKNIMKNPLKRNSKLFTKKRSLIIYITLVMLSLTVIGVYFFYFRGEEDNTHDNKDISSTISKDENKKYDLNADNVIYYMNQIRASEGLSEISKKNDLTIFAKELGSGCQYSTDSCEKVFKNKLKDGRWYYSYSLFNFYTPTASAYKDKKENVDSWFGTEEGKKWLNGYDWDSVGVYIIKKGSSNYFVSIVMGQSKSQSNSIQPKLEYKPIETGVEKDDKESSYYTENPNPKGMCYYDLSSISPNAFQSASNQCTLYLTCISVPYGYWQGPTEDCH